MTSISAPVSIPKWLWSIIVVVLSMLSSGAASTVGVVVYIAWNHESRLTRLEKDVESIAEMRADIKSIGQELVAFRREFDRSMGK